MVECRDNEACLNKIFLSDILYEFKTQICIFLLWNLVVVLIIDILLFVILNPSHRLNSESTVGIWPPNELVMCIQNRNKDTTIVRVLSTFCSQFAPTNYPPPSRLSTPVWPNTRLNGLIFVFPTLPHSSVCIYSSNSQGSPRRNFDTHDCVE